MGNGGRVGLEKDREGRKLVLTTYCSGSVMLRDFSDFVKLRLTVVELED